MIEFPAFVAHCSFGWACFFLMLTATITTFSGVIIAVVTFVGLGWWMFL